MIPEPSRPGAAERRRALAMMTRDALRGTVAGTVVVSGETSSMAPFLRGGDRISWRRDAAPRVGDLLLYLGRPGPVVHRVVGRRGADLVTQGDNRPLADVEAVEPGAIVGVVVALERGGRRWTLGGPGPRLYARGAAFLSRAGGGVYRGAALVDAALRRLTPGRREVRPARRVAWAALRACRALYHGAFFRACHGPGVEAGEEEGR